MAETHIEKEHIHEVEIIYTSDELARKLIANNLTPQKIYKRITTNQTRLTALHNGLRSGSPLILLCEHISNWSANDDPLFFTININQLIFRWMQAIEADESIQTVLRMLKCFQIKSVLRNTKTESFHQFLNDLLIETLQKYHLATLDYLLNFDEDLNLANANQIIPQLDDVISKAHDGKLTALLSLHFKIESSTLILPKTFTVKLNQRLAEIIKTNLNADAKLFFSGDSQFDIILPHIKNKTQLDLERIRIAGAFEEITFINKQSALVKPFIGCAFIQGNHVPAQTVFEHAKLALEHAILKQKYYIEYSIDLAQYINEQIALESKILEAFNSNNLTLAFQPIIDLNKLQCIGAEVLLRWSDKFGQNVPPALTIEVLNNSEKGKLFTRWLINSTCRYAYELTVEKGLDIYLAVNLRSEDLYDIELPTLFENALKLWKLDPRHIILEITEHGILEQNEYTNTVITALSKLGLKFALDDFGTGFSSLTRLRTLPIDLIKIDQSFVKNINDSEEDYKIVESIAMLATSLGKEVLAEGIENEACLALINKLNISKCQGYHFSKPVPYDDYIKFVETY